MPTHRSYQASIEQLHQEVEALAEEMRRPAPTTLRVTLLPFSIGAAFALTLFTVVAFVAKHV
jgi:ABC-type Fe3+ transport system permease subunit